jgi:hypothetical protein
MTPADPDAVHRRFRKIVDRVDAEFAQIEAEHLASEERNRGKSIRGGSGGEAPLTWEPSEVPVEAVELGCYQDEGAA